MSGLLYTRDSPPRVVTLTELASGPIPSMATGRCRHMPGGHYIAMIAQNGAGHMQLSHDVLWKVFGLTTKEAEIAMALLEGKTVGEMAVEKQVSKQTLRNQLGSIMRKTQTRRQTQLVTLLTHMALAVPA